MVKLQLVEDSRQGPPPDMSDSWQCEV